MCCDCFHSRASDLLCCQKYMQLDALPCLVLSARIKPGTVTMEGVLGRARTTRACLGTRPGLDLILDCASAEQGIETRRRMELSSRELM
ncbi:hypothetical protein Mapa_000446 [Marchantia paleacea]|nr:hypothetical protein Mapa_000446 [Marchantia paleacea]